MPSGPKPGLFRALTIPAQQTISFEQPKAIYFGQPKSFYFEQHKTTYFQRPEIIYFQYTSNDVPRGN